jgi:hypothetical protein
LSNQFAVKKSKQVGAGYQANLRMKVYNSSTTVIPVPWVLELDNASYTGVNSPSGWTPLASAGIISGPDSNSSDVLQPNSKNHASLQATVEGSSALLTPTQILLNGVICTVK